MLQLIASNIMRTTLDIDDPILREVKAIHEREGRSMGAIVSELLAEALVRRRPARARASLRWISRPMKPLIALTEKEAVHAALDSDRRRAIPSMSTCCSTRLTVRANGTLAPTSSSRRVQAGLKYSAWRGRH